MLFNCNGTDWDKDELSPCILHRQVGSWCSWGRHATDIAPSVFQIILPLIICGVSLCVLAFQLARSLVRERRGIRLEDFVDVPDDFNVPVLQDGESEIPGFAGGPPKWSQRERPINNKILIFSQGIACAAVLAIQVRFIVVGDLGHDGLWVVATGISCWSYILLFTCSRLAVFSSSLWPHAAWVYSLQWLVYLLPFRSAMLAALAPTDRYTWIIEFVLRSLLFLSVILIGKQTNKAPYIAAEKIRSSRIPSASILSLLSFAWLDPTLQEGSRKTLESYHIPGLEPEDTAVAVTTAARQSRSVLCGQEELDTSFLHTIEANKRTQIVALPHKSTLAI